MSIKFNSAVTKLKGAAPWFLANVVVGSKPIFLYAYGMADGDKICVRRIVTSADESGFVSSNCSISQPVPGSVVARSDVNACGNPVCMDKDNASVQLPEPGSYELVGEGPGFAAGTITIEEVVWTGEHSPLACPAPIDIGSMPPIEIAEIPDLNIAELPDLVIAEVPDLVIAQVPDLVIKEIPDVVIAEVPDLVIKEIPDVVIASVPDLVVAELPVIEIKKQVVDTQVVCGELWYIWSDGTKTTETLPVCPVPVVYCASLRLSCDGQPGFGYHINDPKDPAATVEMAPCAGDTSVDSLWIYPSAGPGHTVKVADCDGNLIGYAVNKSDCAADCGCPKDPVINVTNKFNPTTNVAAPTVNVAAPAVTVTPVNNFAPTTNVAAPAVTNNFAPTTNVAAPEVTNNFAPTTNVAAPEVNITQPAPNVVAHALSNDGVLTTTLSNGDTVVSNPLPSC
jgi:hypothetical protein